MGREVVGLIRARRTPFHEDSPVADFHPRRRFEEARPDLPDGGRGQRGLRRHPIARHLNEQVSKGAEPKSGPVGAEDARARAVREEVHPLDLDPVLHLPARAVDILVESPCIECPGFEVGDHEARVASANGGLGLAHRPASPAPARESAVGEVREPAAGCLESPGVHLAPKLAESVPRFLLRARVAGQPRAVIPVLSRLAPGHDPPAGKTAAARTRIFFPAPKRLRMATTIRSKARHRSVTGIASARARLCPERHVPAEMRFKVDLPASARPRSRHARRFSPSGSLSPRDTAGGGSCRNES